MHNNLRLNGEESYSFLWGVWPVIATIFCVQYSMYGRANRVFQMLSGNQSASMAGVEGSDVVVAVLSSDIAANEATACTIKRRMGFKVLATPRLVVMVTLENDLQVNSGCFWCCCYRRCCLCFINNIKALNLLVCVRQYHIRAMFSFNKFHK